MGESVVLNGGSESERNLIRSWEDGMGDGGVIACPVECYDEDHRDFFCNFLWIKLGVVILNGKHAGKQERWSGFPR